MFDLWMSNFDVGTVLLPARRLYLFHYLVLSVKTVVKSHLCRLDSSQTADFRYLGPLV